MNPEPVIASSTNCSFPQNYIALVKYVPARNVGMTADGRLDRSTAGSVINPLDQRVLMFAYRMRETIQVLGPNKYSSSKIVCIAMAPPTVEEVFQDCLPYADEAVLLADRRFAGADTIATSYTLNHAIDKVVKDYFHGNQQFMIFAGEESQDGSTGHIPPQVAQGRGVEIIPYVTSFRVLNDRKLALEMVSSGERAVCSGFEYPLVVSLSQYCREETLPTLEHVISAQHRNVVKWSYDNIKLDETRIGKTGSKTVFVHMYRPEQLRGTRCLYLHTDFGGNLETFLAAIDDAYKEKVPAVLLEETSYSLDEKIPSNQGSVCVFAEQINNTIADGSVELISEARTHIAKPLGVELTAVLVGHQLQGKLARELIAYGTDKVYQIEHPLLEKYLTVFYRKAITQLITDINPQILLFPATHMGRVLAPSLASALETGITADCTGMKLCDYERSGTQLHAVLKQTRPAGGGVIADIITAPGSLPQMMTVRPHTFARANPDPQRLGEIIPYVPDISETDRRVGTIQIEQLAQAINPLLNARIVVSGGRGLRDKDSYDQTLGPFIEAVSRWLQEDNVSKAVSREMADRIPAYKHLQVGQSGITLPATELYFALGISGAPQHIAGMKTARTKVAVNNDPSAPIFDYADFGIVGDVYEVVLAIIEELAKKMNRSQNGCTN